MAAIRLLWRSSAQRAVGSARTDLLSCSSMGLPGHLLQVRASCYGELNDEGCNLTLPALAGGLDVALVLQPDMAQLSRRKICSNLYP